MLETVTLLGERQTLPTSLGRPVVAQVVVGIERADGTKVSMRSGDDRYPQPHRQEAERTALTLGVASVDRLVNFYDRVFVRGEEHDFDCHSFSLYVAGARDRFTRADLTREFIAGRCAVSVKKVREGTPFACANRNGPAQPQLVRVREKYYRRWIDGSCSKL